MARKERVRDCCKFLVAHHVEYIARGITINTERIDELEDDPNGAVPLGLPVFCESIHNEDVKDADLMLTSQVFTKWLRDGTGPLSLAAHHRLSLDYEISVDTDQLLYDIKEASPAAPTMDTFSLLQLARFLEKTGILYDDEFDVMIEREEDDSPETGDIGEDSPQQTEAAARARLAGVVSMLKTEFRELRK